MRPLAPLALLVSVVACNAVVGWDNLERANGAAEQGDDDDDDDAGTSGDVKKDASKPVDPSKPKCDLTKPFGAPVKLEGPVSSAAHETAAALTADEKELFFQRTTGPDGGDILHAKRDSTDVPFGEPTKVTELGSSGVLYSPTITGDGIALFYAELIDRTHLQIYGATRPTRTSPFERVLPVTKLASGNSIDDDFPTVTGDGRFLFFSSTRNATGGKRRIFQSERDQLGDYTTPTVVQELTSTGSEMSIALSADKLTIYFGSTRAGGPGDTDIWMAHRTKDGDPWKDIEVVPNVNTPETDWPHWVSPDGCRLYLSSVGAEPGDIKVATRPL